MPSGMRERMLRCIDHGFHIMPNSASAPDIAGYPLPAHG